MAASLGGGDSVAVRSSNDCKVSNASRLCRRKFRSPTFLTTSAGTVCKERARGGKCDC